MNDTIIVEEYDSNDNFLYQRFIKKQATDRNQKGNSLLNTDICDYCVVDIETTGLDTYFNEIIELAAIKIRNNEIVDKFQTLIKPYGQIDEFIEQLTGITNDMVKNAPKIEEKLNELFNFIGNDIIVGHNVNFDINFLYDESLKCYGDALIKNNFVDTMRIGRKCIKDTKNHKLNTLALKFNIDTENEHRALADCIITYKLFNIEKDLVKENPECLNLTKSSHILSKDISANTDEFDENNPFYDQECVFTGVLDKMQRKDAMQIIANMRGINADRVTKNTNYLILGNTDYCSNVKNNKTNKVKDAEKKILKGQDIKIISENVFYDMISDYQNK